MFWAGCPCCCATIFSDTFNRANSTNIGSDWTEVSGDWSITSNQLRISATASAIATCNTSSGQDNCFITVKITMNTAGDKARIIGSYVDANNYFYAEITCGGAATLVIGERSGGVDATLKSVNITMAAGSGFHEFTFCVDESTGHLSARKSIPGTGTVTVVDIVTLNGTGVFGVGSGGTCAGTIDFDDFDVDTGSENCTPCHGLCGSSTVRFCKDEPPARLQIDVFGITNNTCASGLCGNLNTSYTLLAAGVANIACSFALDFAAVCADCSGGTVGYTHIGAGLTVSAGVRTISVSINSGNVTLTPQINFAGSVSEAIDCKTFSNQLVPWTNNVTRAGCTPCIGDANAYCLVTALDP